MVVLRMNKGVWSDAEKGRLALLWGQGVLVRFIAADLMRTVYSVAHKAESMGLPRRTPEYQKKRPSLAASGLPAFLIYEDDPRAETDELDLPEVLLRGDVTAQMMGDPLPGRGAKYQAPTAAPPLRGRPLQWN